METVRIGAGCGLYEIGDDYDSFVMGGPYYDIGAAYGHDRFAMGADAAARRVTRVPALARNGAANPALQAAIAQRVADQGTIVREREPYKSRQYAIPFDSGTTAMAAGATQVITSQPQVLFRPERLVVSSAIAASFLINDFKVGKNSQFATSGSHPADAFAPNAFGVRLKCDTAQVSHLISLSVTNNSAAALRFLATLFGEAVE